MDQTCCNTNMQRPAVALEVTMSPWNPRVSPYGGQRWNLTRAIYECQWVSNGSQERSIGMSDILR